MRVVELSCDCINYEHRECLMVPDDLDLPVELTAYYRWMDTKRDADGYVREYLTFADWLKQFRGATREGIEEFEYT